MYNIKKKPETAPILHFLMQTIKLFILCHEMNYMISITIRVKCLIENVQYLSEHESE